MSDDDEEKHAKDCVSKAEVEGTCGAGKMTVDDFLCVRIQVYEHPEDELPRCYRIPLGA